MTHKKKDPSKAAKHDAPKTHTKKSKPLINPEVVQELKKRKIPVTHPLPPAPLGPGNPIPAGPGFELEVEEEEDE